MRKITLIMALAVLTCALCGCGNDASSKSSETTTVSAAKNGTDKAAATQTAAVTTKPRVAGMNYYDTKDGMFTFALSSEYKEYANEMLNDCEYTFTPDDMTAVGFMPMVDYHHTAKGFTMGMMDDFYAKFDSVDWEETTVTGLPAVKLTARKKINGTDNTFEYYMAQYGNGDLFMVAMGIPAVSSYKIDIEEIFRNVEYKGAPLKTGEESCQCDCFELTVPEAFYVSNNKDNTVGLKHNLANSTAEYMCKLSFSKDSAASAEKARDTFYEKRSSNKSTVSIEKSEAEIAGRKAYRVFSKTESATASLTLESFYFEENSSVYSISIIADKDIYEQFKEECQPIIACLKIK